MIARMGKEWISQASSMTRQASKTVLHERKSEGLSPLRHLPNVWNSLRETAVTGGFPFCCSPSIFSKKHGLAFPCRNSPCAAPRPRNVMAAEKSNLPKVQRKTGNL